MAFQRRIRVAAAVLALLTLAALGDLFLAGGAEHDAAAFLIELDPLPEEENAFFWIAAAGERCRDEQGGPVDNDGNPVRAMAEAILEGGEVSQAQMAALVEANAEALAAIERAAGCRGAGPGSLEPGELPGAADAGALVLCRDLLTVTFDAERRAGRSEEALAAALRCRRLGLLLQLGPGAPLQLFLGQAAEARACELVERLADDPRTPTGTLVRAAEELLDREDAAVLFARALRLEYSAMAVMADRDRHWRPALDLQAQAIASVEAGLGPETPVPRAGRRSLLASLWDRAVVNGSFRRPLRQSLQQHFDRTLEHEARTRLTAALCAAAAAERRNGEPPATLAEAFEAVPGAHGRLAELERALAYDPERRSLRAVGFDGLELSF